MQIYNEKGFLSYLFLNWFLKKSFFEILEIAFSTLRYANVGTLPPYTPLAVRIPHINSQSMIVWGIWNCLYSKYMESLVEKVFRRKTLKPTLLRSFSISSYHYTIPSFNEVYRRTNLFFTMISRCGIRSPDLKIK